jgi:hypothetical protein
MFALCCQRLCGSQKWTCTRVVMMKRTCSAIFLLWSHASARRNAAGSRTARATTAGRLRRGAHHPARAQPLRQLALEHPAAPREQRQADRLVPDPHRGIVGAGRRELVSDLVGCLGESEHRFDDASEPSAPGKLRRLRALGPQLARRVGRACPMLRGATLLRARPERATITRSGAPSGSPAGISLRSAVLSAAPARFGAVRRYPPVTLRSRCTAARASRSDGR